jgi:hypothetical protein
MKTEPFYSAFGQAFQAVFIDGESDVEVPVTGTEWVFTGYRVEGRYEFGFYLKRGFSEEDEQ